MASFDAACLDRQEREKDINIRLLSPEVAADFIMSWPIELTVPTIPIYVRGSNPITRKTYRFKCTTGSNFPVPLDGPLSMDHVHFLLDCFVVSSGPERIHLGRYHPQSDPEQFVSQNRHVNTSCPNSEEAYFSRLRAERGARPSIMPPDTTLVMPESYNPDEYTFKSYFVDFPIKADRSSSYSLSDLVPSSDDIMREVEGVKVILEPLLDGHDLLDWERAHYLTEVLHMLPEGDLNPPAPHFPVGDLENEECGICYETQYMYRRACCSFPACNHCLKRYYASKVENGQVKIECCNPNCKKFVHREEISARLDGSTKEKFNTLLLLANQDENTKTCPRCNHLTEFDKAPKVPRDPNYPNYPRVACPSCQLQWCFQCHAPAHGALTCRQYKKGDHLLRNWARARTHGQQNAQKCPKCKIYIERTTGCDHMHCTSCSTDFCYKCGEKYRYLKFFGDHYSKLSIFGCKYRFKANQPFQRRAIRGAVFGGKLIAAPVLGALAICAGALAMGISLVALPVYGGMHLFKICDNSQTPVAVRRRAPPNHYVPNTSLHLS